MNPGQLSLSGWMRQQTIEKMGSFFMEAGPGIDKDYWPPFRCYGSEGGDSLRNLTRRTLADRQQGV